MPLRRGSEGGDQEVLSVWTIPDKLLGSLNCITLKKKNMEDKEIGYLRISQGHKTILATKCDLWKPRSLTKLSCKIENNTNECI